MPSKDTAEKRIKQSEKRHERNVAAKSKIKTAFKKALEAVEQGKTDEVKELVKTAVVTIDTAASKKIMHKNKAARKKSRLMKKMNEVVKK
ncbi:MAG: 30S ribosomal protein S20 [Vulcanimicrobiota bacterium]